VARRAHETSRGPDGRAEQDPEAWWRGVAAAVTELGPARARTIAICATGQGPTLVAADAAGRPVRPAITWQDTRPSRLAPDDPDGVAGFTIRPAIRWLAAAEPDVLARSASLLNSWDWAALRLCGIASASRAPAEPVSLSADDRLGVAVTVGSDLGPVLPAVASDLGLPATARVVAGTNDGSATIVGSGLRAVGDAVDVGGASGGIAILSPRALDLPGIYCAPSLLPDRWIVGGAMSAIGASFDWLRRAAFAGTASADELLAAAGEAPPGADGLLFLPYLAGERSPIWDDDARGAFVGLRTTHGRGDLVRAVLEGGAFALRHVAAPIAAAGVPIGELRLAGRPATSEVWSQIKSDVLGVPAVTPAVVDASVFGAATIAAVGVGAHPDLETAIAAMRADRRRYRPEPATRAVYDPLFELYRRLYPVLRPTFATLTSLT
jgi:xylulokinase